MRKILVVIILIYSSILSGQTEEDFDQEFLDNGSKSFTEVKRGKWEFGGFLQASYQQAVPFTNSASDYQIVKIEERGRLDVLWTYGIFSAKATVDAFYYPRQNFEKRIPHNRIDLPEVYFQGGEKIQFKVGVQKFAWGSCELFRLTRYFSRYDLSEFVVKDPDDISRGVSALSLKYLFDEFSIEAVWAPFHAPAIIPEGFWEMKDEKPYQSELIYSDSLDYAVVKSSAGLRFGGTLKGIDVFLSYFNGYASNSLLDSILFASGINAADNQDVRYDKVNRENRIEYFRVNNLGFELSTVVKKFTIKFEAIFTPDMVTARKVNDAKVDTTIENLPDGDSTVQLTEKERVPYFAYSVGSDVHLWGRSGMILVEWTQGLYLKNFTRYSYPATSYLLLLMLQDSFFDKRLTLRGGTLLRPVSLKPGGLVALESAWKIFSSFELSLRGSFFFSGGDPLFKFFERKHLFELKARYIF